MHPIHDVDVVILLATMMSSKRRPAELVELVAAADMIQGFIPYESKLGDAVSRLSCHGLICQEGQGFALTPDATKILAAMPRRVMLSRTWLSSAKSWSAITRSWNTRSST